MGPDRAFAYEINMEGSRIAATMTGSGAMDIEVASVFSAAAEADPFRSSKSMLVDTREFTPEEFDLGALHRLAVHIRTLFRRGPHYRFAIVGSQRFVETVGASYTETRDIMSPLPIQQQSPVRFFTSYPEAETWLDGNEIS